MRRVRWVALGASALAVAVAGSASAVTLPGQSATMSVSGRVSDAAGNGIRGMCVEIDGTADGSLLTEVGSSSTDASGNYRVTWQQSPNGVVQAPYTAFATADCGAGGWWQQTTYNNIPIDTAVGHRTATGINMTAAPAGRITGIVVDNRDGHPLSGISVGASDPAAHAYGFARTASDGTYTVGGLPSGGYTVELTQNDVARSAYLGVYVPQQPTASTASVFTVTVGQTTSVNARMPRVGHVRGTVTNRATGLPLRGILVEVYPLSGPWQSDGTTRTATDGSYDVTGLGPGTYAVCFQDNQVGATSGSRCFKNQPYLGTDDPYQWRQATPVSVAAFGAVAAGVDQGLPISAG